MNIVEVERGLHSCQEKGCKSDARWRIDKKYMCLKHFKRLLTRLSEAGVVVTIGG